MLNKLGSFRQGNEDEFEEEEGFFEGFTEKVDLGNENMQFIFVISYFSILE